MMKTSKASLFPALLVIAQLQIQECVGQKTLPAPDPGFVDNRPESVYPIPPGIIGGGSGGANNNTSGSGGSNGGSGGGPGGGTGNGGGPGGGSGGNMDTSGGGSNVVKGRPHPLDPLTDSEISTTTSIIRANSSFSTRQAQDSLKFLWITLKEPKKSVILPYFLKNTDPPRNSITRFSHTFLLDVSQKRVFEIVINLDKKEVETWDDAPLHISGSFTSEEHYEAEDIARADPDIQDRCRRLGWTDMNLVVVSFWPKGYIENPDLFGRRLSILYFYGKNFPDDNQNAHPFDFIAIVDLIERKVVLIEDLPVHSNDGTSNAGVTVPRAESQWDPALRDPNSFRKDLKPVRVSQAGTSFTINENEISWQKFKFRVGFNAREGLVIYKVSYNDAGKVRPLFYRMSIAEMFIHYGDPRKPYYRKQIFNEEEQYGLGFTSNSLNSQVDCVGETKFLDYYLHNQKGEPKRFSRAVCVVEEDAGILWKHTDYRTGKSAVVRNQRLALTFIATVGQYEYGFAWHFYLDGTIEFKAMLTGILNVNLLAINATPAGYGTIVFPQINAQYHQHFFTLRLDADIDGERNSVLINDVIAGPEKYGDEKNPFGTAFTVNRTLLKTTGTGKANTNVDKSRTWVVTNKHVRHKYTNDPVAYKLMPWNGPPLLLAQDNPFRKWAAILDYSTWVTPYKENQLYPRGRYLNSTGIPEYVKENPNEDIVDKDVVIWKNVGISHVPRVEDYPVMPLEACSVFLKPYNFFLENPAMDVPPAGGATHEEL